MELNERIDELEELEKERTNLDEQGMELNQMQRVNTNKVDGLLNEKLIKEEENTELLRKFNKLKIQLLPFQKNSRKTCFPQIQFKNQA